MWSRLSNETQERVLHTLGAIAFALLLLGAAYYRLGH